MILDAFKHLLARLAALLKALLGLVQKFRV
jgi:hypothetical protein